MKKSDQAPTDLPMGIQRATKKRQTNLSLEHCLQIPRFNYRNITDSDWKELKAFAKRLLSEGQLTPIRVAELTPEALKDEILQEICKDTNLLLIDGERRLVALSLLEGDEAAAFTTISVELIPVSSLQHYLALQMTFNMDRKNTTFTENGFGFKRYIENGGTKPELLKCINFPAEILTKKDRLKYITERIDLIDLDESLYPYLNNGLIRSYKSKSHQGYLIKGYSKWHQQALASEFAKVPTPKTDDGIIGFFNRFRVVFSDPPFDPEDAELASKEFDTGVCTDCPHLKTVEEEDWYGNPIETTYCYLVKCFEHKAQLQAERLREKLIKEKIPFVLLGQSTKKVSYMPAEEELENGLKKVRFYKLVAEGSCSHAIAGIADFDAESALHGAIHYVCPEQSGCVVHHPEKKVEKQEKRTLRLNTEKVKVEKATRIATAMEWSTKLLTSDYSAIKDELLNEYLLCSFEYLYRASDSDTQEAFLVLIQSSQEKPFKAWSRNALMASFAEYGIEKSWLALLLAHFIHDFRPPWEQFADWGQKAKLDFADTLNQNLQEQLKELTEKHTKRQEGWTKEKERMEKKIHALYFDLPLYLGIHDWSDEAGLLEILTDETLGRKACRLLGVTIAKDAQYIPEQILEKLKGKKAELDTLFPKYSLPKQEKALVDTYIALSDTSVSELIPDTIQVGTGIRYSFVRQCIEKANSEGATTALAEFLNAKVLKKKVVLPLLHKETISIARKVIKQESLTGYFDLDKKAKSFTFSSVDDPMKN